MALSPETITAVVADVIADELIPKAIDAIDPTAWSDITAEAGRHGVTEPALVAATHRYAASRRAAAQRAEELALRVTRSK